MELQPYVDAVRQELAVAAAAGGPDAQQLADRLTAPLESAIRLALLEALSEAAEQITRDLAPASVDVRLRGRDPELTITTPIVEGLNAMDAMDAMDAVPLPAAGGDDDGGTWRVSLRLPEQLRPRVDAAARGEGLSVNAWLVRVVSAALSGSQRGRSDAGKQFSGWVR
jgi:hypothetical protein